LDSFERGARNGKESGGRSGHSSFRYVVAVGYAREFDVFGNLGTVIFRGLLDLLGIVAADHVGVMFVAEGSGAIVTVFLKLVDFCGESGEMGSASLILVRV